MPLSSKQQSRFSSFIKFRFQMHYLRSDHRYLLLHQISLSAFIALPSLWPLVVSPVILPHFLKKYGALASSPPICCLNFHSNLATLALYLQSVCFFVTFDCLCSLRVGQYNQFPPLRLLSFLVILLKASLFTKILPCPGH